MLGSISDNESAMSMDITSMCNINMVFMAITVLVSIFISSEFRSGYAKNLFTVRSNKLDYVFSKTLVCFVGGTCMIVLFFLGSLIGGAIVGVSFELVGVNIINVIMCVLSKIFLVSVFASIFVMMSIVGREKFWLSLISGLGVSMLLFMMIPIVSPLNSSIINVILSFAGGILFSIGLGPISKLILTKSKLV